MPTDTNEKNPTMLDRMAGENETLGAAVMALFVTLVMKALGLNKQAVNMTRRANGFQAKDAMGILEAGRMASVVQDLGLNKRSTLDDYRWTLNELGAGRFSIIDNNGQPRTLRVGESAAIDKVLNSVNGRKAVKCMAALRRVATLNQARLDALRRSLATDTEEIEEGYAPANRSVMEAFGLDEGDVVRFVELERAYLMQGDLTTKQGLQQYATAGHLNLNVETVLDWFKGCVDGNAYYCYACTKRGDRGYFPTHYPTDYRIQRGPGKGELHPQAGKPHPKAGRGIPVNWSSPAVLENTVSAQVAASWGIPEKKTGSRRCPTCDCPAYALSSNSNTAHLPLLTFNGKTCEGVGTVSGAVRAVSFRMDKEAFKVCRRAALDKATPTDAIHALMNARVNYRVKGKEFAMARLVPVWFHHASEDGSHIDRLGLALEPVAHASGDGDLNDYGDLNG